MMERIKLRGRLQFLIQLQQLHRRRRPKVKKDVARLGKSFKAAMDMVPLRRWFMFYVIIDSCFSAIFV